MLSKVKQRLFSTKPQEGASYEDDILGAFTWDGADQEWVGSVNGLKVIIAYEKSYEVPKLESIENARELFSEPTYLNNLLDVEKTSFIDALPSLQKTPEQLQQIRSLSIQEVHISTQHARYLYMLLEPEMTDDKLWRVFFHDGKSGMLGFDS